MSPARPGPVLFELPIRNSDGIKFSAYGSVVCTEPSPKVYLVTFTHGPDNRLVTALCQPLLLALDILEHRHAPGVVITTSSIPKFYSNGMDLNHSRFTRDYMPRSLYAVWKRLLTYPMPTVALCNGHAFAGGLMLAMMHDYRVMNPHRGYLCLNELELGVGLRAPMMAVFREKVSAVVLRKMVLEAWRYKALDALDAGVVDHLGGLEETLVLVEEMRLVQKAQAGVSGVSAYGDLKREMWRETVELLENWTVDSERPAEMMRQVEREQRASRKKVEDWERTKAKL